MKKTKNAVKTNSDRKLCIKLGKKKILLDQNLKLSFSALFNQQFFKLFWQNKENSFLNIALNFVLKQIQKIFPFNFCFGQKKRFTVRHIITLDKLIIFLFKEA